MPGWALVDLTELERQEARLLRSALQRVGVRSGVLADASPEKRAVAAARLRLVASGQGDAELMWLRVARMIDGGRAR